jgi:hypothetical protein
MFTEFEFLDYDMPINTDLDTLSLPLWFYSAVLVLGRFFNFLILYTIGRTP